MRKIDKYVLSRYLKNLGTAFGILMFIFMFHTIWLFINELAGKDIGFLNILKFLFYYTPSLIYITLPLAVIISSIMTFGAFAESYEFVAMKSSGLSLFRIMRSIIVVMCILSIVTFYISNTLIPYSQYKTYNFRANLKKIQPAIAVTEGVFSNLGDYNIKVADKYGERDQFLKDVIIHRVERGHNKVVIKARQGEFISSKESDILQLVLKDGNYYEDVNYKRELPHVKSKFDKYTLNIDLSEFNNVDLSEEKYSNSFVMLTSSELAKASDSLENIVKIKINSFGSEIYRRTGIETLGREYKYSKEDTIFSALSIEELIFGRGRNWKVSVIVNAASSNIINMNVLVENYTKTILSKEKLLNKHIMSLNKKFSLAVACIILFFTAAPFGALIRKGGIGLPLVIAIILFLVYHFTGMFAKKLGEDGSINPILAAWVSDIIMLPLGVYLTRQATSDRGILAIPYLFSGVTSYFKKILNKTQIKISNES